MEKNIVTGTCRGNSSISHVILFTFFESFFFCIFIHFFFFFTAVNRPYESCILNKSTLLNTLFFTSFSPPLRLFFRLLFSDSSVTPYASAVLRYREIRIDRARARTCANLLREVISKAGGGLCGKPNKRRRRVLFLSFFYFRHTNHWQTIIFFFYTPRTFPRALNNFCC